MSAQDIAELAAEGLTESQARLYLALVKRPQLSAADLCDATQIPRSHLYNLLQDLQGLGLVEFHLQAKTRTYRAKPFRAYRARRAADMRETLAGLEARLREPDRFVPPDASDSSDAGSDASDFRLLKGRKAVNAQIRDLLDNARDTVVAAASGHAAQRLLQHLIPRLEPWHFEGPQVEFYTSDAESLAKLEIYAGVIFRKIPPMPHLLTLFVDGREGILVQAAPNDPNPHHGSETALATVSRGFIESHVALQRAAAGFATASPTEVSLMPADPTPAHAAADAPHAPPHEPAILVVDDNAPLARALAEVLERRIPGVRVACASDGAKALRMMDEEPFDLLVSDYRMPGMDGVQLLTQARAKHPDVSQILMTAYADLEMLPRAVNQAHVNRFLTKPLHTDSLVSAATSLLEESRHRKLRNAGFDRARTLLPPTRGA